jgi:hypothetical protein
VQSCPPRLQCTYEWGLLGGRILKYTRYPENTRGVFYYHNPADGPEFYAGVRFRICDSAAEFERGRDLLDPRGDVWGPKILELVKHKGCQGFLSLLQAEHLTDEELVNDINKLDITTNMRSYRYSLSYPFYLDLVQPKQILTYVTRAELVHLLFPQKIFAVQAGCSDMYPLTGRAYHL